jgi:N-acetyl-anhydromuramyl-L-alanine amidase AmpD
MIRPLLSGLLLCASLMADSDFDQAQAARFARLALDCVHKEYPNKIAHSLNSDADVKPPRELTPAFYGCYDWHSSVHGHWLLVRLIRLFPQAPFAGEARRAVAQSLTDAHIA